MTPPELARISGTTTMPLLKRISSASKVVGPLAPSTMYLALILSAFSSVIWFSMAAGMRTSTFRSNNSSLVMLRAFLNPLTLLLGVGESPYTYSMRAGISRPSGLYMPPSTSLTATILAPISWSMRAAWLPTFPNPWMAMVLPFMSSPYSLRTSLVEIATPLPVASFLPLEPPMYVGFPVTTAGSLYPLIIL